MSAVDAQYIRLPVRLGRGSLNLSNTAAVSPTRPCDRRDSSPVSRSAACLLDVVLGQAASESFLLSVVIGIVQCREIGDALFRFVSMLRINNLQPEARGQRIQKVQQAVLVILAQAPAGEALKEGAFDHEESMGNLEERFQLAHEPLPVLRGVGEDRIEFLRPFAFNPKDVRGFGNGIVAGLQRLAGRASNPTQAGENVGHVFPVVDEDVDRRHRDLGLILS